MTQGLKCNINPAVGICYFPPGLQLLSKSCSNTALWPVAALDYLGRGGGGTGVAAVAYREREGVIHWLYELT